MIWRGWGPDLKYAWRALWARPVTTLTVVATIALATGATTAVYSVVDGVLLHPLPYAEPDRLVRIHQTSNRSRRDIGAGQFNPQAPIYYRWLEAATGFESLGAYVDASFVLRGSASAEVLKGQEASSGFFQVLGVPPILGRSLESADDEAAAPPVVVLGEALWRERFGGSPDALGAALVLDGTPHSIVGVMAAGFQGPQGPGDVWDLMLPGGPPLLWTPLTDEARRGWKNVSVIGRVDEGLSLRAAEERFAAVHASLVAENLDPQGDTGVLVSSLLDSLVSGVNTTLWFLLGSVALVLIVATVNIANILLALGLNRRRELAVRAALGASSGRLVRSMLVESTLLALIGGLGGIAAAWIGLPLLLSFLPPTVPRQELIGIDARVLLWGVVLTAVTSLFVGSLPAILAARTDPQQAMRAATRSFTSGRAAGRVRSALVVAEVALAFVLLIGAGLLGGSYARLMSVERGFDTGGLAAIWVQHTGESYRNRDQLTRTLRSRLEQIPGVSAVAANHLPLTGLTAGTTFYLERAATEPETISALVTVGQENYFDVLGIPILAGREFEPTDNRESPPVAIVNETMARRYWPDSDAVGRRLKTFDAAAVWVEIVGIAADVRHEGLTNPVEPTVFLPAAQSTRATNEWIVRVRRGDMAAALQQARAVIASVSPTTPVSRALILEETIARSVAIPRFRTFFILGLAGLAAALALLGVYGVLTFVVTQRTKEIGIRMALGARSRNVLTSIVGSGLKLAATGVAVGLLAAWSATSVIRGFLFEVAPNDPRTYFAVAAGLLAATCLAAYLPARRAAAANPAQVLNDD